jgi:hypothetical protein
MGFGGMTRVPIEAEVASRPGLALRPLAVLILFVITAAVLLMVTPSIADASSDIAWSSPEPETSVNWDVDLEVVVSSNVTNVTFFYRSGPDYHLIANGTYSAPNQYVAVWNTRSVGDGTYDLFANATLSGDGNVSVILPNITIDNTAPSLVIVNPMDNVRINSIYIIRMQASLDVVDVRLWSNIGGNYTDMGSALQMSNPINWTYPWNTREYDEISVDELLVSAVDAVGNEARKNVLNLTIDNVEPVASMVFPQANDILDGYVHIKANTTEEHIAHIFFEWRSGDGEWTRIADANWNEAQSLWMYHWNTYDVGERTGVEVRVVVVDDLGQNGNASATGVVIVDSPPSPQFVTPEVDDHVTGEIDIVLTSQNDTVRVDLAYMDGMMWLPVGEATRMNDTHWILTWDTKELDFQATTLNATAYDSAGSGSTHCSPIEVDNTAPAPQIIKPEFPNYHLQGDVAIIMNSDRDTVSISAHYHDGTGWVYIDNALYNANKDRWQIIWEIPATDFYYEDSRIRVTARDEVGIEGETVLDHRILGNKPDDVPPEFLPSMPEMITINEDSIYVMEMGPHVTDDDKSTLMLFVTNEPKDLIHVTGENLTGNLDLTFKTLPDASGEAYVEVYVEDASGRSDRTTLYIIVVPVQDPPRFISIPPHLYVRPDTSYTFNFEPYVYDVDTRTEFLSVVEPDDSHVSKVPGWDLALEFQYVRSELGKTYNVNVTIMDPSGLYTWTSVRVNVLDDWVPELREPLPDVEIAEDEVKINAFNLDNFFHDKDQDALYYSYGNKHVRVVIGAEYPHPVSIYPPKNWYGTDTVTFRATDPALALVEDTIIVRCISANDPPAFRDSPSIPLIVLHENQTYGFDLAPYVEDVDHDLEDLRIETEDPRVTRSHQYPLGLQMFYPYRSSNYVIIIEIFDPEGASTGSRSISVRVSNNNYPPFMQTPPGDLWLLEGSSKVSAFTVKNANDPDWLNGGGSWRDLTYEFVCDHAKCTVDGDGWVEIQLKDPDFNTFNETVNNPIMVLFRVKDDEGAFTEYTFLVTVQAVNDPPQVDQIGVIEIAPSVVNIDLRNYLRDVDTPLAELKFEVEDSLDPDAVVTRVSVHGLLLVLSYQGTPTLTDRVNLIVTDGDHRIVTPVVVEVTAPEQENTGVSLWVILLVVVTTGSVAVVVSRFLWGRFEPPSVSDVFLVYGDGVIIRHMSKRGTMSMDEDLAIAMLTAIQEFVQQSMRSAELKSMRAGENNILIERDPSKLFYIAVIHTGTVSEELRKAINYSTRSIKEDYGSILQKWDGNIAKFDGVETYLDQILSISHAGIPDGVRFEMEGITSIEPGKTYLFQGKDVTRTHNIFRGLVEEQNSGVLVSRVHPQRLHPSIPEAGAECIWLSKTPTKRGVSPSNTTMILHEITTHVKENPRSVACLDGLEYLLVHNPLDEVVAFVSELTDMAQVDDFIMMIHVDPYALDDATLAKLSRNMVPVTDRTPPNGK